MPENQESYTEGEPREVIIVGGGPAGLSCALMLGRYRRHTLLFDDHHPRNYASACIHGLLAEPDIPPSEFLQRARKQIDTYPNVERRKARVVRAWQETSGLLGIETESGETHHAHRLLLATGVEDRCPDDISGFNEFYGKTIYHCPDCDGHQATGKRIGILAWGEIAAPYAMEFLSWTRDMTILANGKAESIPPDHRARLEAWGVPIEPRKIARFDGRGETLDDVSFVDGTSFDCDLVYFYIGQDPRNELARQLGCILNDKGHIEQDRRQRTSVANVFAAGDIAPPDETVVVAMAQGQVAAITINRSLFGPQRWMG